MTSAGSRTRTAPRAPARGLAVATRHGLPLLAALALCPLATVVIGDDAAGPIARARALIEVERFLGAYVEPIVHRWALEHPHLMTAAGAFYVFAHLPVAAWALVWTWFLRRDRFRVVRDTFLWTQLLLVAVYVAVPT